MDQNQIETIVREVLLRLQGGGDASPACDKLIPAEMSARHVHLSTEDLRELFGLEKLACVRNISQPGQFLSDCRVRLIGPQGILENVAVLGPTRGKTQVETSATDARTLGVAAPVRLSGELADAAEITLQAGSKFITRKAAIIARRHLHMTPADAAAFGVRDGQCVSVRVLGSRPLVLEEVPVRVTEASALALHMDTDEANAAGAGKDCRCRIVGICASGARTDSVSCAPKDAEHTAQAAGCVTLPGKLITEFDIKTLRAQGTTALCVAKGQIITPLARDTAKALGITLSFGG